MQEGVGSEQAGRWRCQAPETLSDHLGDGAETPGSGELLWVARMRLAAWSRPLVLSP